MISARDGQKMNEVNNVGKDWHLDRKVTLGIILALVLNAGSSIWWASRLDYTVQAHEKRISDNEGDIRLNRDQNGRIIERLAGIEANQKYQNDTLKEIKEALKP
jgi:hypothetical protein